MAVVKNHLKASSIIEVVMAIAIIGIAIVISSMVFVNVNKSANTLQEVNEEGSTLTRFINNKIILEKENWYPEGMQWCDFSQNEISKSEATWQKNTLLDRKGRVLWQYEIQIQENEE